MSTHDTHKTRRGGISLYALVEQSAYRGDEYAPGTYLSQEGTGRRS